MSREKGKRGEREVAELMRAHGLDARRGAQHRGGAGSPDVLCDGVDWLHVEVKRTEALALYPALEQAKRDAGGKVPTVWHRRNDEEWVVVVPAEAFLRLIAAGILVGG